jgi:hypothetical protein
VLRLEGIEMGWITFIKVREKMCGNHGKGSQSLGEAETNDLEEHYIY